MAAAAATRAAASTAHLEQQQRLWRSSCSRGEHGSSGGCTGSHGQSVSVTTGLHLQLHQVSAGQLPGSAWVMRWQASGSSSPRGGWFSYLACQHLMWWSVSLFVSSLRLGSAELGGGHC